MYLEEQKLLLCGIDHGFSTMKTAHFMKKRCKRTRR